MGQVMKDLFDAFKGSFVRPPAGSTVRLGLPAFVLFGFHSGYPRFIDPFLQ